MSTLLDALWDTMNTRGIVYCVLRRDENLLEEPDVDLLVRAKDRAALETIMMHSGFIAFSMPKTGSDRFYLILDYSRHRWLLVQAAFHLHYGKTKFFQDPIEEQVLARREAKNNYFVPAPLDQFRILFLHCLLDKGHFRKYWDYFLGFRIEPGSVAIPGFSERQWLPLSRVRLNELRHQKYKVWANGFRQSLRRQTPGYFWRLVGRLFVKVFRLKAIRPGFRIAFLGPDGSGKTTAVQNFAHRMMWPLEVLKVYLGDNRYLNPLAKFIHDYKEKREKEGKKDFWLSSLHLFLGYLDKCIRVAMAEYFYLAGGIALFDRSFHDLLANPEVPEGSFKYRLKEFLYKVSPKPDLVIFLEADAAVLHARKSDHPLEFIEKACARYQRVAAEHGKNMIRIKADQPPEAVVNQCLEAFWERWSRRWLGE